MAATYGVLRAAVKRRSACAGAAYALSVLPMRRPAYVHHPLVLMVVAVALAGSIAAGSAPPHAHGDLPGLYNSEHDLVAFATLSSAAALVDRGATLVVAPVTTSALDAVVGTAPATASRAAASRAPPRA
jgi:hypothetical protein